MISEHEYSGQYMPCKKCRWLVISNLITTIALLVMLGYYRVPQKAFRRLVVEGRVPLVVKDHANNRYYQLGRDIHSLYQPKGIRTIVIGDSLLGNASMQELFNRTDIAGRTIYGDTSSGVLERLSDYKTYKLSSIVLLIGTNDALNGTSDQLVTENFASIIAKSRQLWPDAKLLLMSIPPMSRWVTDAESMNQSIVKWNEHLAFLAGRNESVTLLPLAEKLTDEAGYLSTEMTNDGVHLSAVAIQHFKDLTLAAMLP